VRVVHVVPAIFGSSGIVGGAERYAFELARHMAEHVDTTLISFGTNDRDEHVGALRVRTIGGPWFVRGQRTNPFSLAIFRAAQHADIVHCHQQHVLASSATAAWCRITGRRVFVSELGGGGWDVSAYVSTDAWFHGHLHLSDYSRQVHRHAANPRACVIGGGVDIEKFSPDSTSRGDGGVLFVGRLLPHKGVEDLIAAIPRGMSLTLVGPQADDTFRRRLLESAQGKAVTFLHGLDDEALVREYRKALCVVLPSVYRTSDGHETAVPELLGQTLLEAMACGIPVLCTRVASMPEVVEDGVTGWVVPPNDPASLSDRLSWLHAHPREAHAMGAAGRRRVLERFTWPEVVSRCLEVYRATESPSRARSRPMASGVARS
jgi:glycosyltransferase involved in cell wall biosynthesis